GSPAPGHGDDASPARTGALRGVGARRPGARPDGPSPAEAPAAGGLRGWWRRVTGRDEDAR
ncbi:hypothetical protein, partial [Cellulomonas shaoxiangyii]